MSDSKDAALAALAACELFRGVPSGTLPAIEQRARWVNVADGAGLVNQGDPSDAVFVVVEGALEVTGGGRLLATLGPGMTAGEMGVLLGEVRTASLVGRGPTTVLSFSTDDFRKMIDRMPGVGLAVSQALAGRLKNASLRIPLPTWDRDATRPDAKAAGLLPLAFVARHRAVPLALEGNSLVLGCVADPSAEFLSAVQARHPSLQLRPVRIPEASVAAWLAASADGTEGLVEALPNLEALLRRMVAEGASDLHLSAGHCPWWRVGGDIRPVPDSLPLGRGAVAATSTEAAPCTSSRWRTRSSSCTTASSRS